MRSRSRSPVIDRRKRSRSRSRSRSRDRRDDTRDAKRSATGGRGEYRAERGGRDRPDRDRRDDFRRDSHSDRREPRDRERDARRPDERERDRYGRDRDGLDGRVRDGLDRREEPGRREQVEGAGGTRERSEHVGAGVAEEEGAAEPPALPSIGDAAKKKEPLSLEELLQRRQAEQEAQAKPVFLTKEQRAKLALQKRAEEAAAARERLAEMRQGLVASGLGPTNANGGAAGPTGRDSREARDRGYERRDDRRGEHDRRDERRDGRRDRRDDGDRERTKEERERQRELELIKQQYLGGERAKKKVLKATERMKFVFDWDADEDTSRDLNPLYQNLHEANLLFGRGFRAGIDRREQKKTAAESEAEILRRQRQQAGVRETAEDRERDRVRRDYADKYEGADMRVDSHWSEKKREHMTERDWRIFREDFSISYKGVNPALPIRNWDEGNLPKSLRKAVERAGYKKPSPIQMAAIPLGLQFRDVIGIAETGSGKTAAFVLPMLVYIEKQPPMLGNPDIEAEGPYSVVLAPTRELAQQIEEEARNLAHYTEFRVVSVVGGQSIEDQGVALRKGCEIVVATPGRLVDCIERSYAVLNQCNYVVLDEADRMIDLGFEPQASAVMGVLDAMPSSNLKPENEDEPLESNRVYRTTYMFSATMPPAVERLARKYLRRPVVITIGTAGKATDNITQRVIMVKENEKARSLEQELNAMGDDQRIIVFANTKSQCDAVARQLGNMDYRVTMLHGGKSQDQREESIKGFREDVYNVLVATDVAGRGIDVPNVALVINYDMANTIEQYTHRIGRTGRAGRKGTAVTFLTLKDSELFYDLKKFLEENKAAVPSQLAQHEAARQKPGTVGGGRPAVQFAKK
ncbi:hypothetical protein CHLNCDRAFT_56582 [Chlorella variabilis]|uniref:DEAD-box ATP-dependent RNA helicase 21 n=1 Tax=Chlorella variabilis TaxID=554065 RepID=E1Z385_CHLVA|nr:hypothetical protein CHLNCDRAFT_56582 [Chlorella variabilis]EFN60128.1 hypothetical protein CHLNCDRAFT_56582 [Chlorella variabilis]|eukprot:XP_005852230.1 hypothetical protein CHLNCDRAFT_56582 [Chlorella variabilis]